MIIILVMQFKILPMVQGIASIETIGILELQTGGGAGELDFSQAFMFLLLIQGFFSGLAIGLLAEGNIKAGIKHSFVLVVAAFLISTGAKLFLGSPVAG